jgi:hypothetical protein
MTYEKIERPAVLGESEIIPLAKHAKHDQKSHGNWAGGVRDRVTASGAYGRDYKSKKAVMDDWNAYKDFQMRGMRGGYINRQDADQGGVEVTVRYKNDRSVMVIKPQKPQTPAERRKAMEAKKPKKATKDMSVSELMDLAGDGDIVDFL